MTSRSIARYSPVRCHAQDLPDPGQRAIVSGMDPMDPEASCNAYNTARPRAEAVGANERAYARRCRPEPSKT